MNEKKSVILICFNCGLHHHLRISGSGWNGIVPEIQLDFSATRVGSFYTIILRNFHPSIQNK